MAKVRRFCDFPRGKQKLGDGMSSPLLIHDLRWQPSALVRARSGTFAAEFSPTEIIPTTFATGLARNSVEHVGWKLTANPGPNAFTAPEGQDIPGRGHSQRWKKKRICPDKLFRCLGRTVRSMRSGAGGQASWSQRGMFQSPGANHESSTCFSETLKTQGGGEERRKGKTGCG